MEIDWESANSRWTKKWFILVLLAGIALGAVASKDGFENSWAFYVWLVLIVVLSVWRARHHEQAGLSDGFGADVFVGICLAGFVGRIGAAIGIMVGSSFG